ncbi:serine/threonine protein kinase [Kribbella sp. NBC_01484]|uniref:serine/threonine-protein kinase n=1 Tax=Kribbella sp. NBC_01484 TaxID=2903579 RepID=UPI002E3282AE|nr:serine/threonine-protein kinase [Kribbella sp. NBC_01484]
MTHVEDPAVIGSFTIQGRLGRGAMGAVYLARSPGGRLVAVKVVRDELAGDAAFRARFAREIEAPRKVGGAFTAAVVDADPDAEHPWLATEYLPGPTLQKAIDTSGPLTPGGVQSLAGGLAEALMAIHASGLIHRDLKPSNIVLTDNGPRVIDFGIARALEEASLTATGVVVGTPGYLSPEQITGTAIGPPSDVFALGAVLVFAASGRGPFAHGNPASLLHRVVHEQPHIPPLPNPLQDVVRRCLARDPSHRPTPEELLQVLGSSASTALLSPPAETIPYPLPPTKLLLAQPQPLQPRPAPPTGAAFTTSRTRPAIIAGITTVLFLAFIQRDPQMQAQHPATTAFFGIVDLIFLYFAIRSWRLVLRRRVVLRLSPQGLRVERGYKQGMIPWDGVTRLRVGGDVRHPWLIAWLEAPYQSTLPAPKRRHHGGIRIYPIAHGATVNRRIRQVDELRAALNWYAGRLHDNSY